jgi:type III pantothenate kinase
LNLVVDIGNTRIKAALFKENILFKNKSYNTVSELISDKLFISEAKNAIIASVVEGLGNFYDSFNAIIPTQIFTVDTNIPLKNLYQSVSTLGSDRIIASVGGYFLYPNTNLLIVDAGTCIKYNFTNSKNEYLGGGISPGIQMKFKSLNQFTSKLPLISFDETYTDLIGTNTQNSILSGILNGTVEEIDGIINQYNTQFTNLICILTGGDCEYLAKRLKNSIFAHQNLILKGLNDILNYNLENK